MQGENTYAFTPRHIERIARIVREQTEYRGFQAHFDEFDPTSVDRSIDFIAAAVMWFRSEIEARRLSVQELFKTIESVTTSRKALDK
jgi:hypothetical protein